MRYIKDRTSFFLSGPTAITLGKFDGVHKGHKKLIRTMLAKKGECRSVVFTFDIPPASAVFGENKMVLTTNSERAELLEKQGVEVLVECPFVPEISSMDPEVFVREILVKSLSCKRIFVGPDFHFGYKREGDAALLSRLQRKYGYQLEVVEKACHEGVEISSSYIREILKHGELEKANAMLGNPFFYSGKVVEGARLGRRIGFPTINIVLETGKVQVPFGVYQVDLEIIDNKDSSDKSYYPGIANIGTKPTVSDEKIIGIETHLLDFQGDLYGKQVRVHLKSFIRKEKKFDSVEALKEQIKKDREAMK